MQAHYFWPLDGIGVKEFEKIWCEVTNQLGGQITTDTIPVMFGRYLFIIYYSFNKLPYPVQRYSCFSDQKIGGF